MENKSTSDEMISLDRSLASCIACYQMQYNENDMKHTHIFIGRYKEVPLQIIKIFKYHDYICNIVSYTLTADEIDAHIFKIIGLMITLPERDDVMYCYDLVYNQPENCYQLIWCDCVKNNHLIIERMDRFPGNHLMIDVMIESFIKNCKL